jgi:hypothetical protein
VIGDGIKTELSGSCEQEVRLPEGPPESGSLPLDTKPNTFHAFAQTTIPQGEVVYSNPVTVTAVLKTKVEMSVTIATEINGVAYPTETAFVGARTVLTFTAKATSDSPLIRLFAICGNLAVGDGHSKTLSGSCSYRTLQGAGPDRYQVYAVQADGSTASSDPVEITPEPVWIRITEATVSPSPVPADKSVVVTFSGTAMSNAPVLELAVGPGAWFAPVFFGDGSTTLIRSQQVDSAWRPGIYSYYVCVRSADLTDGGICREEVFEAQ